MHRTNEYSCSENSPLVRANTDPSDSAAVFQNAVHARGLIWKQIQYLDGDIETHEQLHCL